MRRRDFIRLLALAAPAAVVGASANPAEAGNAQWRTYEITTTIDVLQPAGLTRIWLPQPISDGTPFQHVIARQILCDAGRTEIHEDKRIGLRMLIADFAEGTRPRLTTRHTIATRNWSVPLNAPPGNSKPRSQNVEDFLKPTRYVPTDGIVKATADEITRGAASDLEKVHAIYEWVVENTYRDPKVRGCGRGDIRPMLEMKDLRGKCADLNALFVGLAKAAGIPSRDVYGIRLGKSQFACQSLGTSSDRIEKAQHCRAEVFLTGYGWVPMDPADVRKVMLEEPPGHLALTNSKVEAVRKRLFGSWEMNWMAYNYAQDVALPGSSGPLLPFFMYPQAETEEGRLDSLDPESFRYEITAREIAAANRSSARRSSALLNSSPRAA